jgi:tRNA A37 threonylcarbamoyladenosine synthetase subunit TsaC/SUA5/YrdC
VFETFGDAVAVYLCQEEPLTGSPSTVVDLAHGKPVILRAGSVAHAEVVATLVEGA